MCEYRMRKGRFNSHPSHTFYLSSDCVNSPFAVIWFTVIGLMIGSRGTVPKLLLDFTKKFAIPKQLCTDVALVALKGSIELLITILTTCTDICVVMLTTCSQNLCYTSDITIFILCFFNAPVVILCNLEAYYLSIDNLL